MHAMIKPHESCFLGPLLSSYTSNIDQTLHGHDKQGLAIVIGMRIVDGGEVDAKKHGEKHFQELNFCCD